MEDEIETAKEMLQQTICQECKSNLKNQVTREQKIKKESRKGGISIRGKGNAIILSLIALSVALVTIYSPQQQLGDGLMSMPKPVEPAFFVPDESSYRRNLFTTEVLDEDYDKALQLVVDDEPNCE